MCLTGMEFFLNLIYRFWRLILQTANGAWQLPAPECVLCFQLQDSLFWHPPLFQLLFFFRVEGQCKQHERLMISPLFAFPDEDRNLWGEIECECGCSDVKLWLLSMTLCLTLAMMCRVCDILSQAEYMTLILKFSEEIREDLGTDAWVSFTPGLCGLRHQRTGMWDPFSSGSLKNMWPIRLLVCEVQVRCV